MKRNSRLYSFVLALTALAHSSLVGCVSLDRSSASGYANREAELSLSRDRKDFDLDTSATELGLSHVKSLSDEDAEAVALRTRLRKAEKFLEGKMEREQYFRNRPYMKNDDDRLEFLSIGSFEGRQRWLNAKGITGTSVQHPPQIQALIDINDITIGMTRQAVRDSWGEPESVEVSGNPIYANERWHYTEQTSSAEGYQTERRMVYFEAGRVIGWESR